MKRIVVLSLVAATAIIISPIVWNQFSDDVLADGEVAINETNFPDANFRAYVKDLQKLPADDVFTPAELASVKSIYCVNKNVKSMKGIEFFTALEDLTCSKNQIQSLDLSKNTKLTYLDCSKNEIYNIIFGSNSILQELRCSSNHLSELDVTCFPNLKWLDCHDNCLSELSVSGFSKLECLLCQTNKLTSLSVAGDSALMTLRCEDNLMESEPVGIDACPKMTEYVFAPQLNSDLIPIDNRFFPDEGFRLNILCCDLNDDGFFSANEIQAAKVIDCAGSGNIKGIEYFTALEDLTCIDCNLNDADISALVNLKVLFCDNNNLTSLDVRAWPNLRELSCCNNPIESLYVSGCKKLVELECGNTPLKKLDVSNCPNLSYLSCVNCNIDTLSVENCPKLKTLHCSNNRIENLKIISSPLIEKILCNNNPLSNLELGSWANLKEMRCNDTFVSSLNIYDSPDLEILYCQKSKLESLNLSNCVSLKKLNCSYNYLLSIDLSRCSNLEEVNCARNYIISTPRVPSGCEAELIPQYDALAKRQNLSTTTVSATSVKLAWDAGIHDIGFEVYRSFYKTTGFALVGSVTTNEYLDSGLKAGKTYYYKVRCFYEQDGEKLYGDYSDVISVGTSSNTPSPTNTPTPDPKPEAPSGVKAVLATATSVNVSWDQVSAVQGYQVWRGTSANGTYNALGSVTTTNRLCTGLTAGSTYYFKVRAYRVIEGTKVYGEFSSPVSVTALKAPSGVKAVPASATSVKVSWSASTDVDGYQVWRGTSKDGSFTAVGSVTATNRVCSGLISGTTYYFKVRAYKLVDGTRIYSSYSSVVSATPIKLSAPAGAKAVSASATSVKVSWNAVTNATGYQVWRATAKDGTYTAVGSVTTTERVCSGLTCGSTYYFKVRAYNEVDGTKIYGAYSSIVSAAPKPAAPTSVKATVSSATKVKVTWKEVAGATGYEVYRSTSKNGTYSKLGTVTTTSRACPGLKSGTTYYFKVRAYRIVNGDKVYSPFSSVVSATPKK